MVRFVKRKYFHSTCLLLFICGNWLVAFFLLSGCSGFAESCVEFEHVNFFVDSVCFVCGVVIGFAKD